MSDDIYFFNFVQLLKSDANENEYMISVFSRLQICIFIHLM